MDIPATVRYKWGQLFSVAREKRPGLKCKSRGSTLRLGYWGQLGGPLTSHPQSSLGGAGAPASCAHVQEGPCAERRFT